MNVLKPLLGAATTNVAGREWTLIDRADRATFVEATQRAYASECDIELSEEDFAWAKARTLARHQGAAGPMPEPVLARDARRSVLNAASQSGRARPLQLADHFALWLPASVLAVLTATGVWSLRDTQMMVATTQYPAWVPADLADAASGHLGWIGHFAAVCLGLLTCAAFIVAGVATVRPRHYKALSAHMRSALAVGLVVALVLVIVGVTYGVALANLPLISSPGGQ